MNSKIAFILIFLVSSAALLKILVLNNYELPLWEIRSIDTMKYSRDQARQTLSGKPFSYSIESQVSDIAKTGANYIAIDTPYDSEFIPVLKQWVSAARENHLKVYFRGNFSGSEGWFGYPRIDMKAHIEKINNFVLNNPDLFQDGDIFSSCPECENGMKANIYSEQGLKSYRNFLIQEYMVSKKAFAKINKNVRSNFFSMNADAAYRVMDAKTTKSLGGIVVIDHYVKSPSELSDTVHAIARVSGGKVMLGEFGAPVPEINGNMSDATQKSWLTDTLHLLRQNDDLIGVNYWVNLGGSTALWTEFGNPKPAVGVIREFYATQ